MNNTKMLIVAIATVLIAGGAGFFGGMQYQLSRSKSSQSANRSGWMQGVQGAANQQSQRSGGQFSQGLRPVTGQILSQDDKSITVKLNDGSSKIVLFSDTATIDKATEATKADLKTGDTVRVFGTANSDGSISAQNIQVNPIVPTAATPAQ